jgi:hypothetical protein
MPLINLGSSKQQVVIGSGCSGFSKVIDVESKSTSTITVCDEDRDSLDEKKPTAVMIAQHHQHQVFKALMIENLLEEPLDDEYEYKFFLITKVREIRNAKHSFRSEKFLHHCVQRVKNYFSKNSFFKFYFFEKKIFFVISKLILGRFS